MHKSEYFVILLGVSDWCAGKVQEINYLSKQLDGASEEDGRAIIKIIRTIAHDITEIIMSAENLPPEIRNFMEELI